MTVLEAPSLGEGRRRRAGSRAHFSLIGASGAPVVVVLGGISATRNVVSSGGEAGWWADVAGDGRAVDTNRFRVLGLDFLDGGRDATGRPRRIVTTHDQALYLMNALSAAGVDQVHAIVGASYGGMVALAFAEHFPKHTRRLLVFSAAHESAPMTTALRTLQRRIVELGLETGRAGEAMAIARGLAMTTYRTATEFAGRFASAPLSLSTNDARFEVDEYLRERGAHFAATLSPERFLALSLSADLHRVDPRRISAPTTVVAAEGDAIIPREQVETLVAQLPGAGNLVDLPTRVGHDAFLVETERVSAIIAAVLG